MRLVLSRVLILLPILILAACRSPKSQLSKLEVELPGLYSTTSRTNLVEGWLETFGDERLMELIKEAQDHNHDLQAAGARLLASHAQTRSAGAGQLPTLSGRASTARNKRNAASGFRIASSRNDQIDLGLTFAWELDLWGKLANRTSAATAECQAVEADLRNAKLSLAANTAKAWFNAVESELQLRLAARTTRSFEENLEVVEQEFQRGIREALDLRLTRANAASAKASLESRRRQRDASARQLEVLLGTYPANLVNVTTNLPTIEADVPTGIPSDLLYRRPDIVAAERRAAAAMERFKISRKDMLPTVSISTTGGTSTSQLKDIFDLRQNVWSLAANATQPFFQGGRLRAARKQAEANYLALLQDFNQTALEAFQDVETTLAAEAYLKGQEAALAISSTESGEAESIAWSQYRRGLVDIITVLEAQRRSVSAQSALITIRNQRLQNRVDLHLALAGDFESPAVDLAGKEPEQKQP